MILTHDLHLHLFGCCQAEDLWQWGKDLWRQRQAGLEWYATEYEAVYGYRPRYQDFWQDDSAKGLAYLKQCYEVKNRVSFPKFQAAFNLIIALAGSRDRDEDILELIMRRQQSQGMRYAEYRLPSPRNANALQRKQYWIKLANHLIKLNQEMLGSFSARLVMTLPRTPGEYQPLYAELKSWMSECPAVASAVVGIDFCMDEEPFPPDEKRAFLARVAMDNLTSPNLALAVLYHVGESFRRISIESSIRWIAQAASMNVQRIGHAISLGLDLKSWLNKTHIERASERRSHLNWLISSSDVLARYGYDVSISDCKFELDQLANNQAVELQILYGEERLQKLAALQNAIRSYLQEKRQIIECCPTSNRYLSQILPNAAEPGANLLASHLSVVIGADDPGIFDCTLQSEETYIREHWGLSDAQIHQLNERAENAACEHLVRSVE